MCLGNIYARAPNYAPIHSLVSGALAASRLIGSLPLKIYRNDHHWHQFIALEDDLIRVARFIEIHPNNMGTFSIELVRLLLATCAQIEIVAKVIAKAAGKEPKNISQIREALTAKHPKLIAAVVALPRYGLELRPFEAWGDGATPEWWLAYNQLKHDEAGSLNHASLKYCIHALGALLLLLLTYGHLREIDWLKPSTAMLTPPEDFGLQDMSNEGSMMNLDYARKNGGG